MKRFCALYLFISSDKKGCTALFLAASKNHRDCVQLLLDNEADPTIPTFQGFSNLYNMS